MTGIELWSTTASSNNSAAPNGWPEGMPPSGVNDSGRQMMAAVREWYETAEWINLGHTPTYIGATQFSVTGDKTTTYQVGRRVKAYGTTPFTIYGTISVSAYSSVTTVTVTWDSGSLNSTLTTIWLGAASVTNPSIYTSAISGLSAAIAAGAFSKTTITGQSSVQVAVGDSIVYSDVSDSDNLKKNTIQGVFNAGDGLTEDTSPAGATDFIITYDTSATAAKKVKPTNLLKAINDLSTVTIDTAADYIPFYDASGSVAGKTLASALAGTNTLVKISTQTASTSSTIDFTGLSSTYSKYILEIIDLVPTTAGQIWLRVDTGGGFISTATYTTYGIGRDSAGNPVTLESVSNNQILLTGGISVDTSSTSGACFKIEIIQPSHSRQTRARFESIFKTDGLARENHATGGGHNTTTSPVTGIRILTSATTIASGTFILYGVV